MFIADSQVHIWGANTPARPWRTGPRNRPHRPQPYSKSDLLQDMNEAGVARAVLVPPSMEGDRNDLVLEAAQLHPDRFAVMGRIAADQPENKAMVSTLKQQPGMMGLRLTTSGSLRAAITERRTDWFWPEAERADVPLMIRVSPDLLPEIRLIAEKHSGLRLTLDHLALAQGKKDEAAFADLPQVVALAKQQNISVKVSALPCYSSEEYPYRGLHKYIRQVYDAYGPERMFWGSDLTRLPCAYRQAITLFTEELPWLTKTDQQWIMGRSLCRWLGWALPAGA